jgi:hypothetical protein
MLARARRAATEALCTGGLYAVSRLLDEVATEVRLESQDLSSLGAVLF